MCVGRASCLTQSVLTHVSVRVSVSQQSAMSDTKCQFQGTETPPPPLNCICKAEGSKEEYGDYYHVSEFQRGRWRKTQTRDEQLYSREGSITKYADLLCVCVCWVCVWVGACDRKVARGDAAPLEETENCHNLHLQHSLVSFSYSGAVSLFQGGSSLFF